LKIRAINVLTVLPAKRKAALPFAIKVIDNHSNSLETYVSREFFEKFGKKPQIFRAAEASTLLVFYHSENSRLKLTSLAIRKIILYLQS
ncbi:hypothetical protein LGW68_00005, partial [Streptococcus mutans]|nr:hypothetical protein [Streptococcus mutans]